MTDEKQETKRFLEKHEEAHERLKESIFGFVPYNTKKAIQFEVEEEPFIAMGDGNHANIAKEALDFHGINYQMENGVPSGFGEGYVISGAGYLEVFDDFFYSKEMDNILNSSPKKIYFALLNLQRKNTDSHEQAIKENSSLIKRIFSSDYRKSKKELENISGLKLNRDNWIYLLENKNNTDMFDYNAPVLKFSGHSIGYDTGISKHHAYDFAEKIGAKVEFQK